MTKKSMLIDASHPEETRVVVVDQTRLEEYDVEVASRRQLKGNIYLAKITRVEPSLQAAFVDYGGDRHGFLAFNEIHPDYYQIPVADRRALLAEQEAAEQESEHDTLTGERDENGDAEYVAGEEDEELVRRPVRFSPRRYKIQEVIKRRQIMLVQVAKEQRGTKGAALTTYLSLAGRCCVLMPNTARGGGISRKITVAADRSRLKKILAELDVPEGMAVIVRTAGEGRSKAEVKRDYEYLLRLWSSIREETLKSMAPKLVYEEGNLIKRSIRDLYGRDIEEIIIQGENEYRIAKEFMKLFTPSHARRVKAYNDPEMPLFHRFQVESQLEAMHRPAMQLKSGGSIVINPTEALVAIDVNSGRATRERHIEETALRTNLEAAEEIARQLRLRDLAGLVVIDFIDMENHRNRGLVERRLRDAMKNDRARIQLGHISAFGLMELSRQRLRPSLLETSFEGCVHCRGTGVRPTTESSALAMLRRIEEEALGRRFARIAISIPTPVAMYLLNEKRDALSALEAQYGLEIAIKCEDSLVAPDFGIERVKISSLSGEEGATDEEVEATESREDEGAAAAAAAGHAATTEREETGKRGRRRRPRRRRPSGDEEALAEEAIEDAEASEETMEAEPLEPDEEPEQDSEQGSEPSSKKRRRGKRGGRRRSRKSNGSEDLVSPPGVEPEAGVLVGAMSSDAVGDEPLPVANIEAQVELEGESQSHPASELDAIDSSKDRARPRRRGGRGRTRGRPADEEAGADSPAVESEQPREVEILGDSVDEPEPSALTANTELATELVSEREPQSGSYATASEEPEESQMTSAPSSDHVDQDKDPAEDMPAHSRESGLEVSAEDEDSTVSEDSERVFHVGRDQRDPMPTEPRKGWWQRFLE